jgi:hypothetical protein
MAFAQNDRRVVRELARQVMEIASLPVQDQKRAMWRKLNRLERVRPMVWINEIPWWEMQCEEFACRSEDPFCRSVEGGLRTTLYLWNHMRTDMVVDGAWCCDFVYSDTGFGVDTRSVQGKTQDGYGFGSRDYVPVISSEEDIELIQAPRVTADWAATERNYQMACDLLGGIMPVEKRGVCHIWFAPWDILIQWWGVTELMVDMVDRPPLVHKGIARMVEALCARLDQLQEQGLLSVSNGNHRVGSGGLGITDELPGPDYDGVHARPADQWGTATGQIFSEVSPQMHWEFCLQHEMRWLERFGLNCYGCCEPLHNKVQILRRIPRLRRVSMSRWVDVDRAAEAVARDYIFSYKPSPSVFAWDKWDAGAARDDLRRVLDRTRGCVVELIMKDISTCRCDPRRLWEWCELAVELAEQYA